MPRLFAHRVGHYLLLVVVTVSVGFPFLGSTSLWDDDEGVNAECTREMREAGTWVVPTFNWELRTAKPVFLYWLMRCSYAAFGENEWAARLPSALLTIGTVLLVYELGRRMFDPATGLLAGIVTVTSLEVCKLAHAATPDATLLFFTVLYFLSFWVGTVNGGRSWFIPCGIASGFAFLTKGPVGLVLPSAVVFLWFGWHRQLWRLFDRRMIWGAVAWTLVAVPWYALVTAETKGEWLRTFFLKENLGRSAEPMENHRGPVVYYLLAVCVFFAPWSAFLYGTIRAAWAARFARGDDDAIRRGERSEPAPEHFLLLWAGVYVLAFSVVATKLPHYIAPAYPALALLTARFLVRWMRGEVAPARWVLPAGVAGVAVTGLSVGFGLLIAGGVIPLPVPTKNFRVFPGIEIWAWIGAVPVAGAVAMALSLWRGNRPAVVVSLAASTILFVGLFAAFPPRVVDQYKATKELVEKSGARVLDRDARVASLDFSQPSLTYYVGRKVARLQLTAEVEVADRERHLVGLTAEFLDRPEPSFLFLPEPLWRRLEPAVRRGVGSPLVEAAAKYDFTRHAVIVVVWNGR